MVAALRAPPTLSPLYERFESGLMKTKNSRNSCPFQQTTKNAMENTATTKVDRFSVQVNGWSYRRMVMVSENQIGLQTTVPSCSHCPTCQGRVHHFQGMLANKPDQLHQWKWIDGANWLFLPLKNEENPLDTLRRVLEVRIYR